MKKASFTLIALVVTTPMFGMYWEREPEPDSKCTVQDIAPCPPHRSHYCSDFPGRGYVPPALAFNARAAEKLAAALLLKAQLAQKALDNEVATLTEGLESSCEKPERPASQCESQPSSRPSSRNH